MIISGGSTQNPIVSILLVSYNSLRFLRDCLESLERHVSIPYEAVLVDNASTDSSAAFVRQTFPAVQVIESGRNLGFATANNLAARHARGRYLLLLNCDTILLTDLLPAVRIFEREPRVAVVGARMYSEHGELRANTGHFPAPWRLWMFAWQWSDPLANPLGPPELAAFRNDWIEGSFLMTTHENWIAVDGMDEAAFMYTEDVEFCAHTRQRGLLTVNCARLMYIHFGGFTMERQELLYAGYRRFHASSSPASVQRRAELVLLAGLIPRIAVFWTLSRLTRRPAWTLKYRKFVEVLRRWKELAPRPSTRRPKTT